VSIKGNYGSGVDRVDIQSSANSITIKVIYRFGWIFDGKCDLEIKVPEKSGLAVETVSAKITVSNINNSGNIRSVSGNIKIEGNFADLEARSTSGDIKISGKNESMDIKTTSGELQIKGSASDIDISSISGDITFEGKYLHTKVKTVSGDITYNGQEINIGDFHSTSGDIVIECIPLSKSDIYAETISGNIEMIVPSNLSAKLRIESFSGKIRIDGIKYNNDSENEDDNFIEISKSLKIVIGTGDSKIFMQSLSGNLSIKGN
jgi:DUF4097 and DUF4098 domain-containing protein YvlB